MTPRAWHAMAVDEVLAALGTDAVRGLTDDEAARRLDVHGPNRIEAHGRPGWMRILAAQLHDVLVWVLLGAAAVSGFALGEWVDAGVILAIVVLNGVLGFVQRHRAEEALAALRAITAPSAQVVRAGSQRTVPAAAVVPGDLVVLRAGDRVPADARLVEAVHLRVGEAILTGESVPVAKQTAAVPVDTTLGDRDSTVSMGTAVVAGRATAVVTATGRGTAVGEIAGLVEQQEDPATPLQRELGVVGTRLAIAAVGVSALVFVLGALRSYPADEMFLTAVALGVAAIPEGLPAVVTITLARGTRRMAQQHALVRDLASVETLGAASVICTDKTGTLTRNELRVQVVAGCDPTCDGFEVAGDVDEAYARVASLCNDASEAGGTDDPVEVALVRSVAARGADPAALRARHPRVDELAFDSSRKRMTTLHVDSDAFLLATKGAPEAVVARCAEAWAPGGAVAVDDAARGALLERSAALAQQGLRTLALAERRLSTRPESLAGAEHDLRFVALVGMLDEPREEAPAAVAEAQAAGVRVVMVTGDHAATASAVAARVGILDGGETLSGRDLHDIDEATLAGEIDHYRVFARVDPADKVKIVRAWKARDAVVAMTGDGVNDAPALRAADIGVAMGSGSDVGRDASDLVLSDDNFASIVAAIREGRRIYLNLQKIVWFLLSANAAEIVVITVGLIALGHLGPPVLATQLLWINLITDGLPVLALAVDASPSDLMRRTPRVGRSLLGAAEQRRIVTHGLVLSVPALLALLYGHFVVDEPVAHVRTLVFTTLVGLQLAHAFVVRRLAVFTRGARTPGNRSLVAATLLSIALQAAIVATPLGRTLFETVALPLRDWLVATVLSLAGPAAIVAISRRSRQTVEGVA